MNRSMIIVACLVMTVSLLACGECGRGTTASVPGGDAAMVGGQPITMVELDSASKGQLQKVETQIYQIKRRALDGLVEEKLIAEAAKKAGKSKEEYLKEEVGAKVAKPTEKEIRALYEARKGRFKEPYEKVKGQIEGYLMQNRKNSAERDLIARLKKETEVKVMLEPPRISIDYGNAPAMGAKDAKITIIEFSDYQCPFCKRVRPTIWRLMDEYKGKINYVFLDFPLSFHQQAKKAHEAARCAGDQGKYYEYNRKIFENQKGLDVKDLKKYAKQLKLDTKEFDNCLDTGKHAATVDMFMEKGMAAGVSGTPAFFVNGIMLSGAQPHAAFVEVIEGELNR